MNDQSGALYNPISGELPHNGVETSVDAAQSMKLPAAVIREQIARYVEAQNLNGATCDEVEIALGISHQTCSARFKDLKDAGRFIQTEDKRPTRSGRNAFVCVHRRFAGQLDFLGDAA